MTAAGYVGFAGILFVGGLLWIILGVPINAYGDHIAERVADGDASVQTVEGWNLIVGLYRVAVPILIILTAIYFGLIRAIEKKAEGYYP